VSKNFIAANICADLSNLDGPSILSIPRNNAVAFSRPVDPRLPNYEQLHVLQKPGQYEAVQIHQCTTPASLRNGRWSCKRRAPFPLSTDSWIDEHGDWRPKRRYGYLNNFCPPLVQALRCNHDLKLITNGEDTKNLAWYITNYATKESKAFK
jgi:hypothetical protein